MKNALFLFFGVSALVALALAIPATANDTAQMDDVSVTDGYKCSGDTNKVPSAFRGAYKKACEAAATEGKKPVTRMMGKMKNALKKKCKAKAPAGKKVKIGCKPCHSGAGKTGNTSKAGVDKVLNCDASVFVDE